MANIFKQEQLITLSIKKNDSCQFSIQWLPSIEHRERSNTPDTLEQSLQVSSEHSLSISNDRLKAIETEGYQKGYQQGLDHGLEVGQQKGVQESQVLIEQLNHLMLSVSSTLAEKRMTLKSEVANLVLIIIEQFFIHQQQDMNHVNNQIDQLLTQINEKEMISIALNPHDLSLIENNPSQLTLKTSNLCLIADNNLRLGGCTITTKHGLFDASIERQIDRLKQVLLEIKQGESI